MEIAIEENLQGVTLARAAGQGALVVGIAVTLLLNLITAGQLHEAQHMSYQMAEQREQPAGLVVSGVGWPTILRADVLREWNDLDTARSLAEEAVSLCQQAESIASIAFLFGVCSIATCLSIMW